MASSLADQHCDPATTLIEANAPKQRVVLLGLLAQLHQDWRLCEAPTRLEREFKFADIHRTLGFVDALAQIARAESHHPDLVFGHNYCRVGFSTHAAGGLRIETHHPDLVLGHNYRRLGLSTHAAGGVSLNDFICAAKVDALLQGRTIRTPPPP